MNKLKKTFAVTAIAAASVLAWEGGSALVENVQFAHAEQQVQTSREQLQKVEELSDVFRNVGKVIEPTVVQIEVTKTVKGAHRFTPDDDFLRRFFHQQSPIPNSPDDNNSDDNSDKNKGDNGNESSPDDGDEQERGTGSGVVMEVDGSDAYILTNNHVAGDATKMTITLNDGRKINNGKTIGADAKSDLAVVKISADHLIAAKWGDSDLLDRGDWVLAFGSPLGYVGSMTHGIVSALHRTDVGILSNVNGYENFIQVDAPINPGNSGGPLVNIHGEVIGINTAIATQSGGFQGIGFAIPSDQARQIFTVLKDKGKVTRGWLGISIRDVSADPDVAKQYGYNDTTGILVWGARQGTPAYHKLKVGDVITGIDGKPVNNSIDLRNQIAMIPPGTNVKLQVFRDGKQQDVTVKIAEQPENLELISRGGHNSSDEPDKTGVESLGIQLSNVDNELSQKFELGDSRSGALVVSVDPRSVAAKANLRPGDLITAVNGKSVTSVTEAQDALSKADAKVGIRLNITNREGDGLRFVQSGVE